MNAIVLFHVLILEASQAFPDSNPLLPPLRPLFPATGGLTDAQWKAHFESPAFQSRLWVLVTAMEMGSIELVPSPHVFALHHHVGTTFTGRWEGDWVQRGGRGSCGHGVLG